VERYLLQRSSAWAVEGLQEGPFAFKDLFLLDQQTLTSSARQVRQPCSAGATVAEKQPVLGMAACLTGAFAAAC
jgi:hypothetical protein